MSTASLLSDLAAWARQPTTIGGVAGIVGILTAVSQGQLDWGQATPLLVTAAILIVVPEARGTLKIDQLVGGVIRADQAVVRQGPAVVETPPAPGPLAPAEIVSGLKAALPPLPPPPDGERLGAILDARDERLLAQFAALVAQRNAGVVKLAEEPAPVKSTRPKAPRKPRAAAAIPAMDTLDVMARTIWAEARSEGDLGMEAVASVILNRAAHPRWWGGDVREVCLAPLQFSCWNLRDPQYDRIRSVTEADPLFRKAREVARRALAGEVEDRTGGADHYFNPAAANPSWARGREASAVIGNHRFLRLEIPPPVPPDVGETPSAVA